MADFHMHTMLIEDVLKSIDYNLDLDIAKLGAQGPDMFYFNVRSKAHAISFDLANAMHNEKIYDQLSYLVHYVAKHKDLKLISFLMGYLSHYILDTIIHPYIFYYSGKYDPMIIDSSMYRGMHLKFERRVDICFIKHMKHISVKKYPVCEISYPILDVPDEILNMMSSMVFDIYQVADAHRFYHEGYQTIKKVCNHFVYDPYGIKKLMLSVFDTFNKHKPIFYKDLSYHQNVDGFDYLNLKCETWYHPVKHTKHQDSVIDLYQKAYTQTTKVVNKILSLILDQTNLDLRATLKNLSFDTGVEINEDQTMKHFNLFIKK